MKFFEQVYLNRAFQAARALRWVPFLQFVGLNGSLPRGEAKESSDIDFLIVGKEGRLWTIRFFSILAIEFLGLRRKGKQIAGRICLNLYLSEDFLELRPHTTDVARAFASMLSLYQTDNLLGKIHAKNLWMKKKTRIRRSAIKIKPVEKNSYYLVGQKILEKILAGWFGDQVEAALENFQRRRIEENPLSYLPGARIVTEKTELAFHPPKLLTKNHRL